MLRMESHHSDTSLNLSARESAAWVKLWNVNYSSADSDTDLTSAIGDKEVAAKAVAFVVNSTRKGIVPLCADVANLLRAKRSLEDRIVQLTKENDALRLLNDERESMTGSTLTHSKQSEQQDIYPSTEIVSSPSSARSFRSGSPDSLTTASAEGCQANKCESRLLDDDSVSESGELDRQQHMGSHSSTSSAPGGQKPDRVAPVGNHTNYSIHNRVPTECFEPVTPASKPCPRADNEVIIHPVASDEPSHSSIITQHTNGTVTLAEVHASPPTDLQHRQHPVPAADWPRETDGVVVMKSPSLSSSDHASSCRSLELSTVETRPSTSSSTSAQLRKAKKTILANNKLSEELNAARATIEKLQREVRDFRVFCKNNNQDGADNGGGQFSPRQSAIPDLLPLRAQQTSLQRRSDLITRATLLSTCQVCAEAQRAGGVNGAMKTRLLKHDAITLFTSDNMLVSIEDSILTTNNQCGTVKFIGHLEGFAPTCLFVGLQLAEKVAGGLDGSFNGKKYFSCPKGRGIFIQVQDIVNVITRKQASVFHKSKKPNVVSRSTEEPQSSSSNGGVSNGGFVSKLKKAAVNIRHTHSHKKISVPGGPAQCAESRQSTSEQANNQSSIITSHLRSHSIEDELPEGFV